MTDPDKKAELAKRRIEPDSIKLNIAGDLFMARPPDRSLNQVFRRYESLLEALANMDSQERLINYKFLIGLILTSHAKKTQDVTRRKELFDLKNQIFFNLAMDRDIRRKLAFKYLISKNFRVTEFCKNCEEENKNSELSRHKWKFCKDCQVDRKFYNVLSMHHKFNGGSATMFLSNDLIPELKGLKVTQKGKIDDFKEEALFAKYHYNVRNLDVFTIESVLKAQKKLVEVPTTKPR